LDSLFEEGLFGAGFVDFEKVSTATGVARVTADPLGRDFLPIQRI